MSKGLYRAIFSLLLACCCLAGAALPAYAASARVKISRSGVVATTSAHRWKGKRVFQHQSWGQRLHRGGPGLSEINQYYHGNTDYNHFYYVVGTRHQGNSGNVGYNRGRNQDNSLNGGNQTVLSGRHVGYRRVNQYYYGDSHFGRHATRLWGYDEVNSGNDGTNRGMNQDNSSNGGNQLIG